ncbi:MAG: tetratricopeptide repeat protein [Planctomycetales bacterium]|nr:tetratricopeptide repeat protein [Planctomycetales bacterium]
MDDSPGAIRPYLTDFGLAKSVATGSKLTRTGQALGTPAYMSPEQARGELAGLTAATDVWAIGCALHEMLVGRPPFGGDTPAAVVGRVLLAEPPRLRRIRPDVPVGLVRVVGESLAKRAGRRYPDASAIREDLDRVLRGERPQARAPGAAGRLAAAAALAGAAALGVLAWRASVGGARVPGAAGARGSEAGALVSRARSLRSTDPGAAASLLGRALEAEPDRHEWRVERGLVLWALGHFVKARAEWEAIPRGAGEWELARLYLGLETLSRFRDEGKSGEEAFPFLEAVADSEGRPGRLARGAIHTTRREWAAARASLRDEPGWEAALLRGRIETDAPDGDPAAELREWDRAISEGIPMASAINNRGHAKHALKDLEGAEADFTEAIRLDPAQAVFRHNRGLIRKERGDYRGALEDCQEAIRLKPEYHQAFHSRGVARDALGDPAGAIADYTEVIRLRPDFVRARNNRAVVRKRAGDLAGALEDLDEVVRLDPEMAEARLNRGAVLDDRGDPAGAIADYTEALRLKPDFVEVLQSRAAVRMKLGDRAGAVADLDAAVLLRPGEPQWLVTRSKARGTSGDIAGAVADLTAALALDPRDGETWRLRAERRRELGDFAGALEDFNEAHERDPGNPEILSNRAMVRMRLGDFPAAVEDLERAVAVAPSRLEFLVNLANIRWMAGDLDGALRDIERAIGAGARMGWAYAVLGVVRMKRGEWRLAADAFREALRLAPDHPMARETRRYLEECEDRARAEARGR